MVRKASRKTSRAAKNTRDNLSTGGSDDQTKVPKNARDSRDWFYLQPKPTLPAIRIKEMIARKIPGSIGNKTFCRREGGKVHAIKLAGTLIRRGQLVCANHRALVPAGAIGIVVEILKPYTEGRTSDIISVHFQNTLPPTFVKIRELDLQTTKR